MSCPFVLYRWHPDHFSWSLSCRQVKTPFANQAAACLSDLTRACKEAVLIGSDPRHCVPLKDSCRVPLQMVARSPSVQPEGRGSSSDGAGQAESAKMATHTVLEGYPDWWVRLEHRSRSDPSACKCSSGSLSMGRSCTERSCTTKTPCLRICFQVATFTEIMLSCVQACLAQTGITQRM